MELTVADFKAIQSTSRTKARLALERVFTNQQDINKISRELLEEWQKTSGVSNKEMHPPENHTD